MLMPLWIVLLRGASAACGFAAVGLALFAQSPAAPAAASLFAGFGFLAGLVCAGLHAVFDVKPAAQPAALAPQALAALVRATLASATAERQARTGTAADRRPTPAELATTTLAGAAASALATARFPAGDLAPVVSAVPGATRGSRRFASSEFGG